MADSHRGSAKARARQVARLEQLRDAAGRMASEDASELVQRFGEMGRRKFHPAARIHQPGTGWW
jgi:hypothetical protein